MKRYIFFAILIFLAGCKSKDEEKKVTIKGKINMNVLGQNKNDSLTLADAAFILVFKGLDHEGFGLDYSLEKIIDGSFSVDSKIGTGTVLIFLDANYRYIGNLSNEGLNLLPLGVLSGGNNTTIDLKDLTMVGSSIIPSHDPFGNEIIISQEQIESLKEIDSFFEALAKNIDPNNDGRPEILDGKKIFLMTSFDTYAGHYGVDNTPFVINDSISDFVNYFFSVNCTGGIPFPVSASLSGPADSAYTDITMLHHWGDDRTWGVSFIREALPTVPHGQSRMPFKKGTYTLDLDGSLYTFDFSCILKKNKMVLAVPTVHLNEQGKIASFSIDYRLPDNSVIAPENIISRVQMHLYGTDSLGTQYELYAGPVMYVYSPDGNTFTGWDPDPNLSLIWCGIYSQTPMQPIDISNYSHIRIEVGYYDLLGNSYRTIWD